MAGRPKKKAEAVVRGLQPKTLPQGFPLAKDVAPTVEARTDYIVRLMVAGRWENGYSHARLATEWDVEACTVRRYAGEAGRRYKALIDPDEREVLQALLGESFRRIARKAERMKRLDWALDALELHGRYANIEPAKRQELTGKGGGPIAIGGPVIMIPPEDDDNDDRGGNDGAPPAAAVAP